MMNKLGIIVPYRNRWMHLQTFKLGITKFLENRDIDYRIIIVEQDDGSAFNRGTLCNIGFQQAKKLHCNYVVFHDVDMIPVYVNYNYSDHPIHLVSDNIPFDSYFGGITLFPVEQFEKINGFSNHYWGWGFEDDDLRYRCELNGLNYGVPRTDEYEYEGETAYLNGRDAYIEIRNKIKYIRDFTLELDIRLGEFQFSPGTITDTYPILTIQGNDLKLVYTSFNRITLQFFDKKNQYYDITSNIIKSRGTRIKIEYKHKTNQVSLIINDELAGSVIMDNILYDYSDAKFITLGTDVERENFFCGSIDKVKCYSTIGNYFNFKSNRVAEYRWKDNSRTRSIFHMVECKVWNPEEYIGTKIPHRRKSIINRLVHEDSGFSDGKWKHDVTRWNQIRFNNEVVFGDKDPSQEGLNTCEYTVHEKNTVKRITHLKVGI